MSTPDPHVGAPGATSLPVVAAVDMPVPSAQLPRPDIRIDGPHGSGEISADLIESAATPQQLVLQLKQLAAQLRARQDELDRREAVVNAREAEVEQGGRSARLWASERQTEFDDRRAELERQEHDLGQRLNQLVAAEKAGDGRRQALAEAEEIVGQREAALELRDQLLAEQIAAHRQAIKTFEAQQQRAAEALEFDKQQIDTRREASLVVVRQLLAGIEKQRAALGEEEERVRLRQLRIDDGHHREDLSAAEQALQRRFETLQRGEEELTAAQAEHQRLHEELQKDRQAGEEALRHQRRQLAQQQRLQLAEIEAKRQAIQRRSEHLDQVQAALEQLRGELGNIHRETLEIRVATEELWMQLSASVPSAKLTRSLSQVRSRLMEDYRSASDQLHTRREELDRIRSELAGERDRLVRQREQFEHWVQKQQQELQAMADRLIGRQKQLDRKEAQLAGQVHAWEIERLESQQELRRLRSRAPEDHEDLITA